MGLHKPLLLLVSSLVVGKALIQPTCPNGQAPKMNDDGKAIQCLPGSSQKVVCGNNHACFFTGMNYVCCPSNEPTEDSQPTCSPPYLTVLADDGYPLKCSARTRTCPRKTQFCSDVGMAYICCEKAIGREPPKEVDPVPRSEKTLECPSHAIGVLNERGQRVICHSKKRCPSKHQFCYGGLKRSICCEHYDTAKNILEDRPLPKSSTIQANNIRIASKLRQVSLSSRELLGTTTERTVIRSDTFVSNMLMPRSSAVATAIRHRNGLREVERLDMSAVKRRKISTEFKDDDETIEKLIPLIGHFEMDDNEQDVSSKRGRKISTTTEGSITEWPLDNEDQIEILEKITRTTETIEPTTTERQYLRELDPFRRARVHSVKTMKAQEKPINLRDSKETDDGFAKPLNIPANPVAEENKKEIAEKFIMQQIRDGWPYADKFYRPDAE
ncbi:unnamed protein product, partial [Mesorhabditis belari]|uniref:Uncharacterized protein n=1 Tax=Mesorhabditis belari TaxID=2138241 RepID=A0AAF3ETI6_9BILA